MPFESQMITESRDRLRRLETRFTKFMEQMGFETQAQKAEWRDDHIQVPTNACSLKECLAVVPANWDPDEEIEIFCKDELILSFYIPT